MKHYATMCTNNNSNVIIHFMLCNSYTQYTHINSSCFKHNNICKQCFFLLYEKLVYTYD